MSPRALVRLGLRSLTQHKLRSTLSILGVVFGVAAVVAMSSVGEGARREALAQVGALGIDSTTGTLEAGKHADVVIWSGDPFSVYSKAEQVYNDGWLVYDRNDPAHQPKSDFNLGTGDPGVGR